MLIGPNRRRTAAYPLVLLYLAAASLVVGYREKAGAASATASLPAPVSVVIATIGTKPVTESDVVDANAGEFSRLKDDYDINRYQLELQYARARYDLLRNKLEQALDFAALNLEAKRRGITPQAVLAELKVEPVSEDEARAFYEKNKARVNMSYEQIEPKLRDYLSGKRSEEATRKLYDDLRAKHEVRLALEPYRVAVAMNGPARGASDAGVTIIEFGDFQCPYCKMSETTLRDLTTRHPQDVRLVFRNMPLTDLHPDAADAAKAAVCADLQGKFWEMHDAMYDDQNALSPDALKRTAAKLGLDVDKFAACLIDRSTAARVEADIRVGRELGIAGTPYFFVNGRPLEGDQTLEKFESLVQDELGRNSRAAVGRLVRRAAPPP